MCFWFQDLYPNPLRPSIYLIVFFILSSCFDIGWDMMRLFERSTPGHSNSNLILNYGFRLINYICYSSKVNDQNTDNRGNNNETFADKKFPIKLFVNGSVCTTVQLILEDKLSTWMEPSLETAIQIVESVQLNSF